MAQKFEESPHPISRKEISRKGKPTMYFQSTTQTKPIVIRTVLACSKLCVTPPCVIGLISTVEIKKFIVVNIAQLSTEDLTKLTHRKDVTASGGKRMRDNEDTKTIASRSHKKQVSQVTLEKAKTS